MYYPHRRRRDSLMYFIIALIIGVVALSCTKDKSNEWMEVPPADHSVKDSVDKWEGWWNEDKN